MRQSTGAPCELGDSCPMMTGGCLCGALRYEAEGEPLIAGYCYCVDCRRTWAHSKRGNTPLGFASTPIQSGQRWVLRCLSDRVAARQARD
ncbi:MAG TPA: hypothetical protein VMW56_25535, partial [Candidatus Margulisiibacteriota bacterium]|nr:hypothetical protein [Candidatus Margulisiibacteriota bacterium]